MLAGCCSAKIVPARRSCPCSSCPRRPPRAGPAASSKIEALRALALAASGRTTRQPAPWPGARRGQPARLCVRPRGHAGERAAGPAGRGPYGRPRRRPRHPARLPGPGAAGIRRQRQHASVGPDAAAVPGQVQQQTGRELKVLAAGSPNLRIAEKLAVALGTVNLHVTTCWAHSAPPTAPRPSPGTPARPGPLTPAPAAGPGLHGRAPCPALARQCQGRARKASTSMGTSG